MNNETALQAIDARPSAPAGADGGRVHVWTLDEVIITWLTDKTGKSGSQKTHTAYQTTLASYRAILQCVRFDLDSQDAPTLATLLQGWAGQPRANGRPITPNTYNQRLAIVSSFYTFARKRRLLAVENPGDLVDRRPVQAYARATPLADTAVTHALAQIDRTTLRGLRDYALLSVALCTGRRLSELAALRWGDLTMIGAGVALVFPQAKGAKVWKNDLAASSARPLLTWLHAFYGPTLDALPADTPIWVSLATVSRRGAGAYGAPLGIQGIADIYQKWLGTSKAHATRHTFAHALARLGAPVNDIQAWLGHASLKTTNDYVGALNAGHNPYGAELARLWGIAGHE